MRQVELSDATFARLQKLAVPLVDTIETVIDKAVGAYEREQQVHQNGVSMPTRTYAEPRQFDGDSPPLLTHTKLLSAKLNGAQLRDPTWNGLLIEAVRLARAKARTSAELRRLIPVNYVEGRKDGDGYHFVPDINLSVQGQDANSAWRGAHSIARDLGIAIEAEFSWRQKDKAAFPGVVGRLSA